MNCCMYHSTSTEIWYMEGVAVQREQVLLHVSVLLFKASNTLHIYSLAIAALLLAVTLLLHVAAVYSK